MRQLRPCLFFAFILLYGLSGCSGDDSNSKRVDDLGLDPAVLQQLAKDAENGSIGLVSSILIQRNGELAFEWYAPGWGPTNRHQMYSVTKSVLNLTVGIAFDEGLMPDLADSVVNLLPQYASLLNVDDRKRGITLKHLLTMRAGFDWPELTIPYDNPANPIFGLNESDEWIEYTLSQPMETSPGSKFCYNTGLSSVVSTIFQDAVGVPVSPYADENLFTPLGIEDWTWGTIPFGATNGGSGLSLRPRDMLKIGTLVLGDGVYNGQRIVSEEWLEMTFVPETQMLNGQGYGLHWWLEPLPEFPDMAKAPAALGYAGQAIYVLQELNMVVAVTSEEYDMSPYPPVLVLHNYVLPAVVDIAQ